MKRFLKFCESVMWECIAILVAFCLVTIFTLAVNCFPKVTTIVVTVAIVLICLNWKKSK